jgi:hypothetical protein
MYGMDNKEEKQLLSGISQEGLPEEFIQRVREKHIESTNVSNSFEETNDIMQNICELNLDKLEDFKTFTQELDKIKLSNDKKQPLYLPNIKKISCDYSGDIWFMLSPQSSLIEIYDSKNIKKKNGKHESSFPNTKPR